MTAETAETRAAKVVDAMKKLLPGPGIWVVMEDPGLASILIAQALRDHEAAAYERAAVAALSMIGCVQTAVNVDRAILGLKALET